MNDSADTPDRIQKKITLRAPQSRVWQAVSDAKKFGSWFGVDFEGPFVAGRSLHGRMRPTEVDAEVAELQEAHRGKAFDWSVEKIEPESRIVFRWHPFAIEPDVDYSKEPTTQIVFELRTIPEGTELTITESGFSKIPLERRAKAFAANEGGWQYQTKLLEKYLQIHGA